MRIIIDKPCEIEVENLDAIKLICREQEKEQGTEHATQWHQLKTQAGDDEIKEHRALWESALKYIHEHVSAEEFTRLFEHIVFDSYNVTNKILTLKVPSSHICEEIEERYLDVVRVAIFNTFGKIHLMWEINTNTRLF